MTTISLGETHKVQYGASDLSLDFQSNRPEARKQWLDDGKTFEKALLQELKQTGGLSFASLSISQSVEHVHLAFDAGNHQDPKADFEEPGDPKPAYAGRARASERPPGRYFLAECQTPAANRTNEHFGLPTGQVFFNGEGRPIPLPASMTRQSVSLSGEGNQIILPDGAVFHYDPWMATIEDCHVPSPIETTAFANINVAPAIEGEWA